MYDAGLPFNCINYKTFDKFIEAVGQYGPGMKPRSYHEVRVTHLKKEVKKIGKIVEEHRVEWNKFECSIMMNKWTARNEKIVINVLVNSPRGSIFLVSYVASNSSTDATKMYNLFAKTIEKIGKENVVQVVTNNASENVSAVKMMQENRYAKEVAGKETAKILISPSFWNDVIRALKVGGPLIRALRMVDVERNSPMGYLYEAMDRAKETIKVSFEGGNMRKFLRLLIEGDQINSIDHAAGHILNPGLFYKNNRDGTLDSKVWVGYHKCIEKLVPDVAMVDQIGGEFGKYTQANGLFGLHAAIRARDIRSPYISL
ncbi:uncharacterized protein LOC142179247 [Nicotiana tabacum]|uniref:Uncharacterized protein LOC142179247 n=1 Tax=Nicotiana tabacum TaxID=4097 RepID=A0AC58U6G1_TOBAC